MPVVGVGATGDDAGNLGEAHIDCVTVGGGHPSTMRQSPCVDDLLQSLGYLSIVTEGTVNITSVVEGLLQ